MGIDMDLTTVDRVPWSDHYALKVQLSVPPLLSLDGKQTYIHLWGRMDLIGFQNALQDPRLPTNSLDQIAP